MIVEIQCLAFPPGTPEDPWRHIDSAIAAIQASGLPYEVGALGTTIEGEPDRIWPLLREVHEACLRSGTQGLVTVIKVEETGNGRTQPTVASLTGKFRGA